MTTSGVNWSSSMRRPRNKQDLLDMLPPKHIADRLVMRYFASGSASLRTYDRVPLPLAYILVPWAHH